MACHVVSREIHVKASARRLTPLPASGHAIVRALPLHFLKPVINTERHGLARGRMDKSERRGAEAHPSAALAVESVARDGASQPVLMGAVHAQLVGPACQRIEAYERAVAPTPHYLIACDGAPACLHVHFPARTVVEVGSQRQVYRALARTVGRPVEQPVPCEP